MRRPVVFVALAVLVGAACSENTTQPPSSAKPTVVRSGVSFGFCLGYCWRQVEITDTEAVLIRRSMRGDLPDIRLDDLLTPVQSAALLASIDEKALQALPNRIGCPDCADAGAEWITVERDGFSKTVVFDFGANIPSIADLVETARAIRQQVETSPGAN